MQQPPDQRRGQRLAVGWGAAMHSSTLAAVMAVRISCARIDVTLVTGRRAAPCSRAPAGRRCRAPLSDGVRLGHASPRSPRHHTDLLGVRGRGPLGRGPAPDRVLSEMSGLGFTATKRACPRSARGSRRGPGARSMPTGCGRWPARSPSSLTSPPRPPRPWRPHEPGPSGCGRSGRTSDAAPKRATSRRPAPRRAAGATCSTCSPGRRRAGRLRPATGPAPPRRLPGRDGRGHDDGARGVATSAGASTPRTSCQAAWIRWRSRRAARPSTTCT